MNNTMTARPPFTAPVGLAPYVFPGAKKADGANGGGDPATSVELLTIDGATRYLNVSEPTVFARIREGVLHAFKHKGRTYLHPHELEEERQRMLERRGRGRVAGTPNASTPPPIPAQIAEPPKPPKTPPKPAPVHQSIATYKGETAGAAYRLFGANKGIRDAVMELEISAELAEHLYEHWKKSGPELHVSPKGLARLRNRFQWFGDATEEGLMRAIDRYLDTEITRIAREKDLLPKEGDPIPEAERALLDKAENEEAEEDKAT